MNVLPWTRLQCQHCKQSDKSRTKPKERAGASLTILTHGVSLRGHFAKRLALKKGLLKSTTWSSHRNVEKKMDSPAEKWVPPSSQVLTQAKTAITSWMLSFCFTSIAFQSLLPCLGDIERIFHSIAEDWHCWEMRGKGLNGRKAGCGCGGVQDSMVESDSEGRKTATWLWERKKNILLQKISGGCLAWRSSKRRG